MLVGWQILWTHVCSPHCLCSSAYPLPMFQMPLMFFPGLLEAFTETTRNIYTLLWVSHDLSLAFLISHPWLWHCLFFLAPWDSWRRGTECSLVFTAKPHHTILLVLQIETNVAPFCEPLALTSSSSGLSSSGHTAGGKANRAWCMSYLQICLSAVTLKYDTLKHPPEFRWQIGKRKAFGECQSSRLRKGALLKNSRFLVSFGFCLFLFVF